MTTCFPGNLQEKKKAQAALEYMMIISIALVLLVPLISVSQQFLGDISDSMRTVSLSEAMDSIEEGMERVEGQGENARITMDVEIPSRVVSAGVEDGYFYYVMEVDDIESDYYRTTDFDIEGSLPTEEGIHTLYVENRGDVVYVTYE